MTGVKYGFSPNLKVARSLFPSWQGYKTYCNVRCRRHTYKPVRARTELKLLYTLPSSGIRGLVTSVRTHGSPGIESGSDRSVQRQLLPMVVTQ